jgi:hypothetical protein
MEQLQGQGVPVYVPRRGAEQSVSAALNMLRLRRMVIETEGLFRADPDSSDILSYYANAIEHWRRGEK